MSGRVRDWMPERVTTRHYHHCGRCGYPVRPTTDVDRLCTDCGYVERGGDHRAHPAEKHEQAAQLRAEGVSNKQIALQLGISHKTVIRWLGKSQYTPVEKRHLQAVCNG